MVICTYFLKGNCKFGDRCFNEHRRPDNRGSYKQGGQQQRNYHQESRDFSSGGRNGKNSGSYDRYYGGHYSKNTSYDDRYDSGNDHSYRNQKTRGNHGIGRGDDGRDGGHDGYGGYRGGHDGFGGYRGGNDGFGGYRGGNDGYSGYRGGHDGYRGGNDGYSGYRGGNDGYSGYRSGNDGYSGYRGGHDGHRDGGRGKNYSRDKYHYDARDKNRFSALSHQPDPEPPSSDHHRSQQTRGRTRSTVSQESGSVDQTADKVKKDMKEWRESGQWPLSCYALFGNEPCLDGLADISPEEMRSEAYKANTEGNAATYAQSLQQTMEKYRQKKQELATMSFSALQDEVSRSSQSITTAPGGLFGDLGSSVQSLFGATGGSMSTSSTGLLGPSPQSMTTSGPFTSRLASTNHSTNPSTLFGTSSSPSGSTKVNIVPSSTHLFGKSQENSTDDKDSASVQTSTDGSRSATVTSLKCSEEDLKAYRANHFVMGAIPECPPPLELC